MTNSIGREVTITVYTLQELKELWTEKANNNNSRRDILIYESAYEKAKNIIKADIIENHAPKVIEKALQELLKEKDFDNTGFEDTYKFYYFTRSFAFEGKYNCYKLLEKEFNKMKDDWEAIKSCCEPNKAIIYLDKSSSDRHSPFKLSHNIFDASKKTSYYMDDLEEDVLDFLWNEIEIITTALQEINNKLRNPTDEVLFEYATGKYFSAQAEPWFVEES